MEPLEVSVKGSVGLKEGLGVDEVHLDFKSMKGLVGFAGHNGMGKSTLMEMMYPFRSLPNRADGFKDGFFLQDSYKKIRILMDGKDVELTTKINAESGRSEAFATVDGVPQVNGKLKEYDLFVRELFGAEDIFRQSAFAAQKGDGLAELKPAAAKELFGQLVQLDQFKKWEETAKNLAALCTRQITELQEKAKEVSSQLEEYGRQCAALEETESALEFNETTFARAERILWQAEEEKNRLQAEYARQPEIHKQLKIHKGRLLELEKELFQILSAEKDALAVFEDEDQKMSQRMEEIRHLVANTEKVQSAADRIDHIKWSVEVLKNKLPEILIKIEAITTGDLEPLRNQYRDLTIQLQGLESDPRLREISDKLVALEASLEIKQMDLKNFLTQNNSELAVIEGKKKNADKRASLLKDRPEDCDITTCPFIADAIAATKEVVGLQTEQDFVTANRIRREQDFQKEILKIEKEVERARTEHTTLCAELTEQRATLMAKQEAMGEEVAQVNDLIVALQEKRKALEQEITSSQNEADSLAETAALLPQIKAQSKEWLTLKTQQCRLRVKNEDRIKEAGNVASDYENKINGAQQKCAETKNELSPTIGERLDEKTREVQRARMYLDSVSQSIATNKERIRQLREMVQQGASIRAEADRIAEKTTRAAQEKQRWVYLQNACSRNGIPTLEIDGIAPTVCSFANALLSSTHPGWSVDIETLDENGKEIFDFIAIKPDGSRTRFGNISGGEGVWVVNATRLGFTLTTKDRAGRSLNTAFADESDSGLHVSMLDKYIEQLREFMKIGRFNTIFLISHNPEVLSQCDHLLVFENGGIREAAI